MAQTLKEAMAERCLSAADLGAFFSTTEAHAARWMNHESKFRKSRLQHLRIEFLRMGVDSFAPIYEELTCVQYDNAANCRRWQKEHAMPKMERKINYPHQWSFGLTPEEFRMVQSLGGVSRKCGILYRRIIEFAVVRNSPRITTIKGLVGKSLAELKVEREKFVRGPIKATVHLNDELLENLNWLALSHGLTLEHIIKKYIKEYFELTIQCHGQDMIPKLEPDKTWKIQNTPYRKRPINYPRLWSFGITQEELHMIRSMGGSPRKYSILYRRIIEFAAVQNSRRIATIKRLIGKSLAKLKEEREEYARGPIAAVAQLTDAQLENLNWLALSHGLTIEHTIKKYIREYYELMKGTKR